MQSNRMKAIDTLWQEARALRAWADANLPERERLEPYMLAARLERTARELAEEPMWLRVGGSVTHSTRTMLNQAQRDLTRRAG